MICLFWQLRGCTTRWSCLGDTFLWISIPLSVFLGFPRFFPCTFPISFWSPVPTLWIPESKNAICLLSLPEFFHCLSCFLFSTISNLFPSAVRLPHAQGLL